MLNQKINSKKETIIKDNPDQRKNNQSIKVQLNNDLKASQGSSNNDYYESQRKYYVEKNSSMD